jgi:hypothetical protein
LLKKGDRTLPLIVLDGSGDNPYTAPAFMLYHGHGGIYRMEIQTIPNNRMNRKKEGKV